MKWIVLVYEKLLLLVNLILVGVQVQIFYCYTPQYQGSFVLKNEGKFNIPDAINNVKE